MKWMGRLKQICKRPARNGSEADTIAPEPIMLKKRMAWQWLFATFVLIMLSAAHIFEIPFMVLNPGFKPTATNHTLAQCNNSAPPPNITRAPILDRLMLKDIGSADEPFSASIKYTFTCGLMLGGFLMGPLSDMGRALTFKAMARNLIVSGLFMSMCRNPVLLGICWFLVGVSCNIIYSMTLVDLVEKFARIWEKGENGVETGNAKVRWDKYKYRLYLGLGFTCVWNFTRVYSLFVAWMTRDWTLICAWLTMIFAIVYFLFGDFVTDNFEKKRKNFDPESDDDSVSVTEVIDQESFYVAITKERFLALNLFILAFNWFVSCHNLYGLVLGFRQISPSGNMFDNLGISNGFSYIALAIKFAVCIAARRKVLPFGLLQLFSGMVVLVMVAFPSENCPSANTLTTGKIFCAHVANVLIAAALGVLDPLTIDTFPDKYRMHCYGICSLCGRLGIMLGVAINDQGYFKEIAGPATAGILSIIAAVLSRFLPDLTLSRLPKTQLEIERQQFPSSNPAELPMSTIATASTVASEGSRSA